MVDRAKALVVIETIAAGKSLRRAAAEHSLAPSTFLLWMSLDKDLADRYARARDAMIDQMVEETLDIADAHEDTNKARLQVDTRKWYASKLAPKRYGDKMAVTGGDETDPPLRMEHSLGGEAAQLVSELLKGIKNAE